MYIESRGKSLIIRWKVDSRAYHISLAKHNHPVGKAAAQMKLAAIEKDILSGHFDPTLAKYCTRKASAAAKLKSITTSELFDRYAACRMENFELSHSSLGRVIN